MEYSVNVGAQTGTGTPAFSGTFKRINVIMGANGAGKTKLLQYLAGNSEGIFTTAFTPVTIEGGRSINIPTHVGMNNQTMHMFSQPVEAKTNYKHQRRGQIAGRIQQTFVILKALESNEKDKHSDAVTAWIDSGKTGEPPIRPMMPFDKLTNLYKTIFPHMELIITTDNQINVRKAGIEHYSISTLSDGEKQVLLLLADIAVLTNETSIFFIDEPELNLHPSLAERLWDSIEESYPDCIFIYTTHNLSFALRDNVEKVFALGYGEIDTANLIDSGVDIKPFLGAIPSIVRFDKCLFVEGTDASFDNSFYKWAINNSSVGIFPIAGSTNVITASARQGIWSKIATGISICGVIDHDYKVSPVLPDNVIIMDLHEAESYLCHPKLVVKLHDKLGTTGGTLTENQVIDKLVEVAKNRLIYVVAQRVFSQTYVNLQVSVERSNLKNVTSIADLKTMVQAAAMEAGTKATVAFDPMKLEELIDAEEKRCQNAIKTRDADQLLEIFEGKRFLQEVCKMAGCPTPSGMLSAVIKHFEPSEVPHLDKLVASVSVHI